MNVQAQFHYDTIIDMGIYKSYFDLTLKQPVAITYTLFNGGGPADRKNDKFKCTSITLNDASYYHTGYDRGHLVSAEDFACSDSLQALTFSYYNVVPQTPQLNRGKWKTLEHRVREFSKHDTLTIICVNEYSISWIPQVCYKFVFRRKKLLLAVGYTNTKEPKEIPINSKIIPFIIKLL